MKSTNIISFVLPQFWAAATSACRFCWVITDKLCDVVKYMNALTYVYKTTTFLINIQPRGKIHAEVTINWVDKGFYSFYIYCI